MAEFVPDTNVAEICYDEAVERKGFGIPKMLKPLLSCCLDLNHTINNPLTGILGFCELLLLEDDPLSDEQKDMVEQMLNCAERIRTHLDVLGDVKMDLSRKLPMDELVRQAKQTSVD